MSEVKTILWTEAGMHHKQALALLLGQDNALRDSLGAYRQITLASLEKEQTDWLKGHCQTLVVLVEDSAVGMISMGGLNCRYVSIGYWIGSAWWGQGMMTQAFTQLVAYAKDESIFGLRARIAHDNAPSIALWKRKGARIIGHENHVETFIILSEEEAL